MGLLDFDLSRALNSDQGRLGLGLLAAAGPSNQGFGQRLQSALGYVQGQQDRDTQKQMQQMQMQELIAQAAARKREAERQAKADAEDQAVNELAKRFQMPATQGAADTSGVNAALPDFLRINPTPAIPAQPGGFDQKGFLSSLPSVLNPLKAMEYSKKFAPKEVEYSTAPQFTPDGRAYLVGKDGSVKWLDGGIKPRDELVETNLGGKIGFRTKYSPEVQNLMDKTASPDAVLSSETSIRGQNMTDARAREFNQISQQQKVVPKPLPASALKMQQEGLDAIGVVGGINADLKALEDQIGKKELSFGPVSNLVNTGRNMAGMSSQESRNFATFKSNMERLRNESLRLNTGVQTDGDAQRAWNELFQNITDTNLVKQRLQEIQRINKRGAELQKLRVDAVRSNYGYEPMDVSPQMNQQPALRGGGATGSFDAPPMPQGFRVVR